MVDTPRKPARIPAMIIRKFGSKHLVTRLSQIGNHWRFHLVLQRFRGDFPLAVYQEIDGQAWWILSVQQREEVIGFCQRNGLLMVEEP